VAQHPGLAHLGEHVREPAIDERQLGALLGAGLGRRLAWKSQQAVGTARLIVTYQVIGSRPAATG